MSFLLPRRGAGMTGDLEQEFRKFLQDGPPTSYSWGYNIGL